MRYAALWFTCMLLTSLVGFGGVMGSAVVLLKALAVAFLVLFFVTLYRVLADVGPARSVGP